jgi:hypothetical protein
MHGRDIMINAIVVQLGLPKAGSTLCGKVCLPPGLTALALPVAALHFLS